MLGAHMQGAQVQPLTPTPRKHFGPLKEEGVGGQGPKTLTATSCRGWASRAIFNE